MATRDYFIDSLISTVDTSRNTNDVVKLLDFIPFVNIQSFIKEQIKTFNLHQSRKAYYTITSINNIFPNDITQYILSFNKSNHINSIFNPICKTFKQFAEKNEE
eukprot:392321_1